MNREELIRYATSLLRSSGAKKPIRIQRHVFRISDEEGNVADFVMKKQDKSVIYTVDDVRVVLDALLKAVEESIKQGEPVSIYGFGTLGVKYRKQRVTRNFSKDGDKIVIPGHYIPGFTFGKNLKMCASIYEDNKEAIDARKEMPWYAIMDDVNDEDGDE